MLILFQHLSLQPLSFHPIHILLISAFHLLSCPFVHHHFFSFFCFLIPLLHTSSPKVFSSLYLFLFSLLLFPIFLLLFGLLFSTYLLHPFLFSLLLLSASAPVFSVTSSFHLFLFRYIPLFPSLLSHRSPSLVFCPLLPRVLFLSSLTCHLFSLHIFFPLSLCFLSSQVAFLLTSLYCLFQLLFLLCSTWTFIFRVQTHSSLLSCLFCSDLHAQSFVSCSVYYRHLHLACTFIYSFSRSPVLRI